MSSLLENSDSIAGFQAEDSVLESLAKRALREERDWKFIHSICPGTPCRKILLPNVVIWNESSAENARHGDIRIARTDIHGRPLRDYCVYIDVKNTSRHEYASLTFKRTGESAKRDAIQYLCGFIGDGVPDTDFWYMTFGGRGDYVICLKDVRDFIQSTSEEELLLICKKSERQENGTTKKMWYMSFEKPLERCHSYDMETWFQEVLSQRLG